MTLLSDITPESLSVSMNWTTDLARFHLGATASTQRIAPLTTIGELRQAIEDGKINDKGRLTLCRNLIDPIHDELRQLNEAEREEYKSRLNEYNASMNKKSLENQRNHRSASC